MPNWISLPPDKLIYQPQQMAFLEARRKRFCSSCKLEYTAPPNSNCPNCNKKGDRLYDRLTVIAGRRFGKTLLGSIAAVEEATIPDSVVWAAAPTNPKLHRYVIPAFQKLIPREWVKSWSSEFNDLRLKNGSLIHFQTLEDPDQGRGQGLDCLWIDEVCELTEEHWNVIRPSLGDKLGVAFFTTSPRSYDWVYEKLYKPAEDGVPGYWVLHAKTADNPLFHTSKGKAFLASEKESMPDVMYQQEYEADFVTYTGSVYGNLLDSQILTTLEQIKHLIPEWPSIESWRQVIVGLDTGADHPFGAVKLISTERGLVVVGDYLERHKSFVEHASSVKRLAWSPNAKWAINKNERQPMIELAQHGIYCQAAENDVVAGTERVKSWLHQKQLWFWAPTSERSIKQMKAYRWDDNTSKDGQVKRERVYKKNDELPDCIRYALMTYPKLPQSAPILEAPQRDLSHMPEEIRASIERLRRIDNPKTEPNTVIGDFWG